MPTVFIPASLRSLTGQLSQLEMEASTVREVVDQLEQRFPGIRHRLCEGDQLRPGLAVAVDSQVRGHGMLEKISPGSEVHFVPTVSGG